MLVQAEEDPNVKVLQSLQSPYCLDVSGPVFEALQALLVTVTPLAEAEFRAGAAARHRGAIGGVSVRRPCTAGVPPVCRRCDPLVLHSVRPW